METAKNPPSPTHTLEDDSLCIECGGLAIGGKGVDCLSLPAIFLFNFFLLLLLFPDFCHRFLSCRVRNPLWPIFCWGNLSRLLFYLSFFDPANPIDIGGGDIRPTSLSVSNIH